MDMFVLHAAGSDLMINISQNNASRICLTLNYGIRLLNEISLGIICLRIEPSPNFFSSQ